MDMQMAQWQYRKAQVDLPADIATKGSDGVITINPSVPDHVVKEILSKLKSDGQDVIYDKATRQIKSKDNMGFESAIAQKLTNYINSLRSAFVQFLSPTSYAPGDQI